VSRIGKQPVPIVSGVTCELKGSHLKVKGPKGTLERDFNAEITIEVGKQEVTVSRSSDRPDHRAKHGLTRALINNMILGVSEGYEKTLEIQGVGYRASLQGKNLNLALGYSHPVTVEPPAGIEFVLDGTNIIKVIGIDKELVGQVAADVRKWRKPEPYKGKGIRYQGEHVRRKVGKAGATAS
jgi:large subunit ribosomal protein L6